MLRIDSMMANLVESEPRKQGNVEELIILSSPSTHPCIGRQRVQHPGETFGIGADGCSYLPRVFIVISTIDDGSLLVLVLEVRILDVDRELYAINKECQRVTDMTCVFECRPHSRCRMSRKRRRVAESVEKVVPQSRFFDDGDAEVALSTEEATSPHSGQDPSRTMRNQRLAMDLW